MNEDPQADRSSVEHRLRRSAPARQAPPPRRWRRLGVDVAMVLGLVAVALLLIPFADKPNPDYPEARGIADRLDAAAEAARSDGYTLEDAAVRHGLVVFDFAVDDGVISVITHPEPTATGVCYGLRVGSGVVTAAVRFPPADGCVPQGRSAFAAVGSWGEVLPSERETVAWFIPAMVLLIGAALAMSTRIVVRTLRTR